MGEIDQDPKGLAYRHRFQAAGQAGKAGEALGDGIQIGAQGQADTGRAECVVDVEAGWQAQVDPSAAHWGVQPEARPALKFAHLVGAQVGPGVKQRIGPAALNWNAGERLVAGVVAVDDRGLGQALGVRARSQLQQPSLGGRIRRPGVVVVEVVKADVGHRRDVKVAGRHAVLDESVRCGLDDGRARPPLAHSGQHLLQGGRFDGGVSGEIVSGAGAEPEVDGAEVPGLNSRAVQDVGGEVGGGGLAVGAGDTGHTQGPSRTPDQLGGKLPQPPAAPVEMQDRGLVPQLQIPFQRHRRPLLGGPGGKIVAVDGDALEGHEKVARPRLAGVLKDPLHLVVGAPSNRRTGDPPGQLGQPHCRPEHTVAMGSVRVMGIVNVTPDSFSGDGLDAEGAIERGREMGRTGATVIDVGGESTRPGHTPVDAKEERRRVEPVIRALAEEGYRVSVDTSKLYVAEAAVAAGATMVNDVWGLQRSPGLARLAAQGGIDLVLMHNQIGHVYAENPIEAVKRHLGGAVNEALAAGMDRGRLIVDPGIGFGKTAAQGLWLLRRLPELRSLGCPILVGVSRKSFLGTLFGQQMSDRIWGTAAAVTASILNGADWIRVHDVAQMAMVARVAEAMRPLTAAVAYIGLGSNLGPREDHLEAARAALLAQGARLLRAGSIRETEPWGPADQPRFLNQVLEIEWPGSARELLVAAKAVEKEGGRSTTYRWGPREIDVDILLFGRQRIQEADLEIPHPALRQRDFVLDALRELGVSQSDW